MENKKLLVGTSKGLVIIQKVKEDWKIIDVHFRGLPVTVAYVDDRNNTWWVGLAHRHWGEKLQRSTNQGKSWEDIKSPKYPLNAKLGSGKPAVLKKIWCIHHAGFDQPNGIWLGTEPGGLFYSKDNGDSFELVENLWNHPSRKDENQWFGAGRDHPFIHSIVVDPRDSKHLFIAVSCAGVFETKDGGINWQPKNKGLIAAYLPNPDVEVGHDPHMMIACDANPDVIWQQNHCGIFKTENGGDEWQNVTDKNGLAAYGFSLAIDHENPDIAWTIPAVSDLERIAPDLSLCVCKTDDGGQTWVSKRNGLPQGNVFDIVFRHSFCNSKNLMAFGTTNGNVYVSEDYGDNWQVVSNNLARVETIKIT